MTLSVVFFRLWVELLLKHAWKLLQRKERELFRKNASMLRIFLLPLKQSLAMLVFALPKFMLSRKKDMQKTNPPSMLSRDMIVWKR